MKTRHIPANYKLHKKTKFVEAYSSTMTASNPNSPDIAIIGMLFSGKRSNPDWHYKFMNVEQFEKKIDDTHSHYVRWEKRKQEAKEARTQEVLAVEVGDIFVYSWGYGQTNVEFFQVIEKKKKSFVMKAIGKKYLHEAPSGDMSDNVKPIKNSFNGDPIVKTTLSMKFGCLSKTTENDEHFQSWYN